MGGVFDKTKKAPFLLILVVFLICCGLETFYYLYPPNEDGHTADPWNKGAMGDEAQNYVSFITNETGQDPESVDIFTGTEVYYKIYNSYDTLTSRRSSIDSRNSSSSSSSAAEYIIQTWGYQRLQYTDPNNSNQSPEPFIPKNNADRYVYIRLSDSESGGYKAQVVTGNSKISNWTEGDTGVTALGVPKRGSVVSGHKGFNFDADDSDNPPPGDDDEDAVIGTATEEGVWFVDLWAFSVGRDDSFTTSYSTLCDLGYVVINEDWYDD